jgi:hypothetical protein
MTLLSKLLATGLLLSSPLPALERLPGAASVLDRYVKVTGGVNAWHAPKSERDDIEGRAIDDNRLVLKATIYTTRSGDSASEVQIPQDANEGVYKGVAWAMSNFSGVRIKHGAEREEAIRESHMLEEADWRTYYPHAKNLGVETVGNQLCYKVQLSPATAEWFDIESGLLVRRTSSELSPSGTVQVGFTVEQWAERDGLRQPYRMLSWRGDFAYRLTVSSLYNNIASLSLPPAVAEYLAADRAGKALPNAEELVERHIYESGGIDAFGALKTQRITGTLTFLSSNTEAHVDTWASDGGRYYQSVDVPGLGMQEEGSDGSVVWERSPALGPRVKPHSARAGLGVTMDAAQVIAWRLQIKQVRTEAREQIDGRDCYRVRLVPRGNSPPLLRWYDRQTGMLYRTQTALSTDMGALPTVMTFEEYRNVAGLKWPTRIRMAVSGQNLLFSVSDVKLNEPIESAVFELPLEVKQIAEQKAGDSL